MVGCDLSYPAQSREELALPASFLIAPQPTASGKPGHLAPGSSETSGC